MLIYIKLLCLIYIKLYMKILGANTLKSVHNFYWRKAYGLCGYNLKVLCRRSLILRNQVKDILNHIKNRMNSNIIFFLKSCLTN